MATNPRRSNHARGIKCGRIMSEKASERLKIAMEPRTLGKTGRKVGVIGLGFEHLKTKSEQEVETIVSTALDAGINCFDLALNLPHLLTGIGSSLGKRRRAV